MEVVPPVPEVKPEPGKEELLSIEKQLAGVQERIKTAKGRMKQALLGKAQLYLNMQDHSSALKTLQKAYQRFPDLHYLPEQIDIIQNIIRTKNKVSI